MKSLPLTSLYIYLLISLVLCGTPGLGHAEDNFTQIKTLASKNINNEGIIQEGKGNQATIHNFNVDTPEGYERSPEKKENNRNRGIIQQGDYNIATIYNFNIGISVEDYEKGLRIQQANFQQQLKNLRLDEKQKELELNASLMAVNKKLSNVKASYDQTVIELKATNNELIKFKDQLSTEELITAHEALEKGDTQLAKKLLQTVADKREILIEETASIYFRLGKLNFDEVNYRESLENFERASQLAPGNAGYLNDTGFLFYTLGNFDEAIHYYEKALKKDFKNFGEDHPLIATLWNNLGLAWHSKGYYDQAIEYYKKALESDLKNFGENHPNVAIRWNNLGSAYERKGEPNRAIEYYKKALAINLKIFGNTHPNVTTSWNNLGTAWQAKGNHDKAIEYFEKALENNLKILGAGHPHVAGAWNNLGVAFGFKGDYDKAISYFEKALQAVQKMGLEHRALLIKQNIEFLKLLSLIPPE